METTKYKDKEFVFMGPERNYHERNAYGEVMIWDETNNKLLPVICGHGGSGWLCRECFNKIKNNN